jgi:hypothetical protein
MSRVLDFYFMSYIVFLSNRQLHLKKKKDITFYLYENLKNPINWQNINLPLE